MWGYTYIPRAKYYLHDDRAECSRCQFSEHCFWGKMWGGGVPRGNKTRGSVLWSTWDTDGEHSSLENSFGANGCRDMEDEFSLSVSPRNFLSKEDRDPPPPKQNLIRGRTEQDVSSDSGKEGRNSPESSEKSLGEKEDPRINRSDHEIMAQWRDKAVRPKKVNARVSPTDLQLSLKEGRGLDRKFGKGDLANKGGRRGQSKDREVKLSILGKEIVEANKCQGTEPENQKPQSMAKEQVSSKGVLIKEFLATIPTILQQQRTRLNVDHLRANQKGMTFWPFDRGKIRESCQHVELMSSTISSYRRGGVVVA